MPATVEELRAQLLEHGDRIRQLRERTREERSADWSRDILETRDVIYALDAELHVAETTSRLPGPSAGTQGQSAPPEFRSPGQLFTESDLYGEWVRQGARGSSPGVDIERRNLISTVVGGDGAVLLPRADPIMPPTLQRRRLFVRDVIAGGSTNLNSVPYVRELNARANEGGASAVAEASAKPEANLQFEAADAPVRTIAAWVPVTMQVLEDIPTMRSYIDGRLGYMIALREEEEILNGPGTGARVLGILNTPGVQTQAQITDNPTTIGRAIGKVEAVDGEADAIAINPVKFWEIATTRFATQFDGGFGTPNTSNIASPYGSPTQMLWGLPVIRSRGVTTAQAVVGAWRMGAQVFDRSTVQIRVTDSHQDFFTSNRLVILAESRLALAVHRPDFFVTATLA
jgi:HK97 family phage major capsid protein